MGEEWRKNESSIETLKREAYEEAALKLKERSIKLFFYQKIYTKSKSGNWSNPHIQIRYMAKIKKIDRFEKDPGGKICFHKWVKIQELNQYLSWGKTTKFIPNKIADFV